MNPRLFPPAPAGFNPLTADDRTLALHGYPTRPVNSPQLLELWQRLLGRPINYVQPSFENRVKTLSVSPGERWVVSVCLNPGSNNSGIVSFARDSPTNPMSTSFPIVAPGSGKVNLDVAEWIVERPYDSSRQPQPLADFGSLRFETCLARTASGKILGIGSPTGESLDMIVSPTDTRVVASGSIVGSDSVECDFNRSL
jgi:hypothetical protein